MGCYILIGLALIVVIILALFIAKSYKNNNKIYAKINFDSSTFFAHGNKNRFIIKKDNRYIFEIVNGRIVSIKERQGFFYKKVIY